VSTPLYSRLLLIAAGIAFLPISGLAASTAYVSTARNLDLSRIRLVIVASPEARARLLDRAIELFVNAGLPRPAPVEPTVPSVATLTLSLNPSPIGPACPGQVLYAPALTLTEPVTIPRNGALLYDSSWTMRAEPQVRKPVEIEQLEADLDGFIRQFIADYRTANQGAGSSERRASPASDQEPSLSAVALADAAHSAAALSNLALSTVQLNVLAGQGTARLRARALEQLAAAGLPASPAQTGSGAVTLGIELLQQPLEDRCPGYVLYTRGLYLVEQVRIVRNPMISIWSDTWLREAVQIVPPLSLHQLESDQDALLQEFIRAVRAN
jgi:hypothetical protein